MKTHSSLHLKLRTIAGFTLMELLVVIVIIGILASFMFPAAQGVLRRAERVRAENTAQNLKASISAYFTEYRKFPVDSTTTVDPLRSDHTLMDVLLASDTQAVPGGLNPRRIPFFSGSQAKPMAGGKFRNGVKLSEGGAGELWDPYGNHYYVRLDTDYNNRVTAPEWDKSDSELPIAIIVWSAGKDGEEEDAKDNIKTW